MSDVKKNFIKSFIELTAAVAVMIGLVFVGLELRQNTVAVQASTFQGMTDTSSSFLFELAAKPDLARVWQAGFAATNANDLSSEDLRTLRLLQNSMWLRMQNAFRQWQVGTLSDEDWLVYRSLSCGFAQRPLFKEYWQNAGMLMPSFKEMLETCS